MKQVRSRTWPALAALLAVFGLSLFCYRVMHANATIAAVVLLLSVLVTSVYAKFAEGVIAAIFATLSLDYFFIPPIGSITIGDPQGWIVLIVFLAVSLIATNLSSRLRRQRDELISQYRQTEKLHALSRSMLFSDGLFSDAAEHVGRSVVNKCMELFTCGEVVLFELLNGRFYRSQTDTSIDDETMRRAARYASIERSDDDKLTVMPVALGNKIYGSIALRGMKLTEGTLQALGGTIAMGIAQAQAHEAGSRAEAVRKSEELKSVMIDALAHDLKTPLTAIEAATAMLLNPVNVSPAQQHDLLEVVQEEAAGVRRIVEEAIHLARIDAKKMKLACEAVAVDDLIRAAILSIGDRAATHHIETQAAGVPLVSADRELIVQALKQLLDNALKYSPSKSKVTVSVLESGGDVIISVRDHGNGLTELEQGRVFDKFYRGRQDRLAVQGTGMGLAIVKEILEAHGGSVGVSSEMGYGSEFFIRLRAAMEQPEVMPQGI